MNLVKVAELLKNAPDQALVSELSNPSGSAPSYMILSELERRKKMRAAYQREAQAPQTSVAEDAEQEVVARMAPAMGLGSMPQAQQFSETVPQQAPQGYARGGEVVHAAGGWWQPPEDADYTGTDTSYTSQEGSNPFSFLGEKYGFIKTLPAGWMNDPEYKKWIELGLSPEQAKQKAFGTDSRMGQRPDTEVAAASAAASNPKANAAKAPLAAAAVAPTPKASADVVAANTGIAANDVMARYRELGAQQKEAYAKQAEMYKTQADELKKSKDTDIGFALMQAGLGIAGGRSSNAIENIGQGAQPALQAYIGMDRARREQLQKLAMGEGQLGIAALEAQMKPLEQEAAYGQGERKLNIMQQEVADKGAYQRGILARSAAASGMKLDPRVAAQAKAIEDEINDTIKLSEGLYGKDRQAAMARINSLRQQKNALFGLSGADAGTPTASIPTYDPKSRSW